MYKSELASSGLAMARPSLECVMAMAPTAKVLVLVRFSPKQGMVQLITAMLGSCHHVLVLACSKLVEGASSVAR